MEGKFGVPTAKKKFMAEIVLKDVENPQNDDMPDVLDLRVATTGREYEECLHRAVCDAGYSCELTPESCDQGVDLVVDGDGLKIAIQCKLYSSPVGNEAVQEVVAGARLYGCGICCVVSNAGYTSSAQELAEANRVILLHHSDLLRFLSHVFSGRDDGASEAVDFEATDEYEELLTRAEKGADDARVKLGDYYYMQLSRCSAVDLSKAAKYFIKACHVGNLHCMMAYYDFCHALKDEDSAHEYDQRYGKGNPFGLIFQEMTYSSREWRLPDDPIREIEYDWYLANSAAYFAQKMPLGHCRDDAFERIGFVKKYWSEQSREPRVMYYLACCKLKGWGTPQHVAVGVALLNKAAQAGHIQAMIDLNSLPKEDVDKLIHDGEKSIYDAKVEEERVERELREKKVVDADLQARVKALNRPSKIISCPNCRASVSTESQFCWSCNAPVPGWTGYIPQL